MGKTNCCIPNCHSRTGAVTANGEKISIFSIPSGKVVHHRDTTEWRKNFVKAIYKYRNKDDLKDGIKKQIDSLTCSICSLHFTSKDIKHTQGHPFLKHGSLPTKCLPKYTWKEAAVRTPKSKLHLENKHFWDDVKGIFCNFCNAQFSNIEGLFDHIPSKQSCDRWYMKRPKLWDEIFETMAEKRKDAAAKSKLAGTKKPTIEDEMREIENIKANNNGQTPLCILFKPKGMVAPPGVRPTKCFLNVDQYFYSKLHSNKGYKTKPYNKQYTCYSCGKMLRSNLRFMSHTRHKVLNVWEKKDREENKNTCAHCYRTFDTHFERQCHVELVHTTTPSQTACKICDVYFESENGFLQHMKNYHCRKEMPYICYVCNFRSSVYSDVTSHFKQAHGGSNFLQCCFCLQVRNAQNNFLTHTIAHVKSSAKCSKCRLQFITDEELQSHCESDHGSNVVPGSNDINTHEVYVHVNYQSKATKISDIPQYNEEEEFDDSMEVNDVPSTSTNYDVKKEKPILPSSHSPIKRSPVKKQKPKEAKLPSYLSPIVIPTSLSNVTLPQRSLKKFRGLYSCWECKNVIGRTGEAFRYHFGAIYECKCCSYMTSCKYACDNHIILKHVEPGLQIDFESPAEEEEFIGFTQDEVFVDGKPATEAMNLAPCEPPFKKARIEAEDKAKLVQSDADENLDMNDDIEPATTIIESSKENASAGDSTSADDKKQYQSENYIEKKNPSDDANNQAEKTDETKEVDTQHMEDMQTDDKNKIGEGNESVEDNVVVEESKKTEAIVIDGEAVAVNEEVVELEDVSSEVTIDNGENKDKENDVVIPPDPQTPYFENNTMKELEALILDDEEIAKVCDSKPVSIPAKRNSQGHTKPTVTKSVPVSKGSSDTRHRKVLAPDGYFPDVMDEKGWEKFFKEDTTPSNTKKNFPYKFTFTKTGLKPDGEFKSKTDVHKTSTIVSNATSIQPKSLTTNVVINRPSGSSIATVPKTGTTLVLTTNSTTKPMTTAVGSETQLPGAPKKFVLKSKSQKPNPDNGVLSNLQTNYLLINDPNDHKLLLTPVTSTKEEILQRPRPPTHLRFSLITALSAVIQWSHPEFCTFTQYKIVFKGIKGPTSKLLPPNQTIVRLVDLLPDTTYDVKVYSLCKNVQSHFIQGGFRTLKKAKKLTSVPMANSMTVRQGILYTTNAPLVMKNSANKQVILPKNTALVPKGPSLVKTNDPMLLMVHQGVSLTQNARSNGNITTGGTTLTTAMATDSKRSSNGKKNLESYDEFISQIPLPTPMTAEITVVVDPPESKQANQDAKNNHGNADQVNIVSSTAGTDDITTTDGKKDVKIEDKSAYNDTFMKTDDIMNNAADNPKSTAYDCTPTLQDLKNAMCEDTF